MQFSVKGMIAALSLGAMTLTAVPALAQPGHGKPPPGHGRGDWKHGGKHAHKEWRKDRRAYRVPGRVVYRYDYNRPDPRYGRYYRADRYYRSGYAPIRVTRGTRIYRGYDDRYYCRRSDGTTGLIVGAALGGLLGSQLDRGRSNTTGILIGAGAGALLGREVDRGSLSCR
ncbi:uncharacterized protein YcfJ [Sphingobium sp. OAS761]|uniref:glycine zipper 2TM domain-containing protein n=1 Tax=Sphingobium sp. OAS761 TaxID=2817901 RepID=UPI00209FC02C|nr:glycine zipper 2TM domain-containing protein [Sphingobium sp. OAS761]MCP1468967.1 uncharacterized protein YcfJ [Sphingobium sp. OAS761]